MSATLRMKAKVDTLKHVCDHDGEKVAEELTLTAVYGHGPKDHPNTQWCKWTPCIKFEFTISNPGAFDKVKPGQFFYVDLIPTTKDDPV